MQILPENTILANVLLFFTCTESGFPVLYILLATLTVSPQMSYCGLCAPITPATTGPKFKPMNKEKIMNINHEVRIQNIQVWKCYVCKQLATHRI